MTPASLLALATAAIEERDRTLESAERRFTREPVLARLALAAMDEDEMYEAVRSAFEHHGLKIGETASLLVARAVIAHLAEKAGTDA